MAQTTDAVPAGLPGPGERALVGQPAGQVGDRGALVGVAAEHLPDQAGLVLDDLVGGRGVRALAQVPVAVRGPGQHVHAPGPGAVGLAAPVPLDDLGLLVLGEHALELDHQLVLGAVPAGALDELHPGPGPGELLDQQRLVGELAGQPVRGVAQHHLHPDPGDQVPQPLQRRAGPASPRSGPSSSNTHSSGTSSPAAAACSRSAAVCEPIVSSFFCRAEETRA